MCPVYCNLLLFTTPMTFELLYTPSTFLEPYIVRLTGVIGSLLFLSALIFHRAYQDLVDHNLCLTCQMRWLQMYFQVSEALICSLDSSRYLQTLRSSVLQELPQAHKFFDDFEILVAKNHSFSSVENRPISSRNHVFYLLFVDLQPFFCCISLQCLLGIADSF
jgi:hypothetical protein